LAKKPIGDNSDRMMKVSKRYAVGCIDETSSTHSSWYNDLCVLSIDSKQEHISSVILVGLVSIEMLHTVLFRTTFGMGSQQRS